MTGIEKRDMVLKEVITPTLRRAGFKKSGLNWWMELEDCYLIIRMRNCRYNGSATGINFNFHFSVSAKENMKGKLTEQWIYNQLTAIEEYYFLPQFGLLHPFRQNLAGYTIDGYKNYEPQDMPIEGIMKQVQLDWETYIIPELLNVHTLDDWNNLKTAKINRRAEKEIRLLLYFHQAHHLSCSPSNRSLLREYQKALNLSNKDIQENMGLLKEIAEYSCLPKLLDKSWDYVLVSTAGDGAE